MGSFVTIVVASVAITLLLAYFAYRSYVIVPSGTAMVIERWGQYARTLGPGLHLVLGMAETIRSTVDMREQHVPFPPQEIITGDKLLVYIDWVVHYQVTDPRRATYETQNYIAAIDHLVSARLRTVVGGMDLEHMLMSREEINADLRRRLEEATGPWSLKINAVDLLQILPTKKISKLMEEQIAAAAQRAEDLVLEGEVSDARRIVQEAIEIDGARSALLWPLAQAAFDEGDLTQALAHIDDAAKLSPTDPDTITRHIRILEFNGLRRQALLAIGAIPAEARGDQRVRKAVGWFYRRCNCFAHAVEQLGASYRPPRHPRLPGLTFWLMGFCPKPIRARIRRWEESNLLGPLRGTPRRWANLPADTGLSGSDLIRLRAELDEVMHAWRCQDEYWSAAWSWADRLLPALGLAVWPALWAAAGSLPTADRPAQLALPSLASALVAMVCTLSAGSVLGRYLWWRTRVRHVALTVAVIAGVAAAAVEGYFHHVLPASGWRFWTVYGLLAAPVVTAFVFAGASIMRDLTRRARNDAAKGRVHFDLVDDLLIVLDVMRMPGLRSTSRSIQIARWLDIVSFGLEYRLLAMENIASLASGLWLTKRAKGWAHALRHLERDVVAAVPGTWQRAERLVRHEIRCLATGDLGSLAWRQPPPPRPARDKRRSAILATLRTILVSALPLTVVLASQPLLHTSPDAFRWARIATGVWALLYLLLSLAPAIGDKIDTARRMVGAVNDAKSTGKSGAP